MNHDPDLNDERELARLLRELSTVEPSAERLAAGGHPGPYHVPEPLDGPGYEVETRTEAGMHTVVGITADLPPSDGDRVLLRSVVRALLDLAGHDEGTAHTRVVLTPRGPQITSCRVARTS